MTNINKLSFGIGNSKLSKLIATFSLPAGHTCRFAKQCLSKVNQHTGKLTDGPDCVFRCFSASQECYSSSMRKSRWKNYNLLRNLKSIAELTDLIQSSLPKNMSIIRLHVSGDFFSERYFLAWLNVALNNPTIVFYGYTKSIPFIIKHKDKIPSNFRITASKGGTHDSLIERYNLKYAEVVFSVNEAHDKGLVLDHDDSHAYTNYPKSFALLLHGMQPASSKASTAMRHLRKIGMPGYTKKKQLTHA